MAGVQMTEAEMAKCVARFSEMKSSDRAYVDTYLPNHEREIFNVIGPGITENPEDDNLRPALPGVDGFHLGYIRLQPGKRGALHAHDTTEIFIPLSGKWIIMWGDNEEHQLELNVNDVIAVPPGVFRCFSNISDQEALMIGMVSNTKDKPHGRITWPDSVFAQVREVGAKVGIGINAAGDIVRV